MLKIPAAADTARLWHPSIQRLIRVILETWSQYFCCMIAGNRNFVDKYPVAPLESIKGTPYGSWRNSDTEDTVRFWALRLHEAGMIKSSPQKILAQGTD